MKKNLTLLFSLSQCAYWCAFATISAFASLYLLSIGVSNSTIGTVIAIGALISAILQPVFGTLSDRYPAFSAKRILIVLIALSFLCAGILLAIGGNNLTLACILYSLCAMMLQLMQPFVNSLAMLSINDGHTLNFSITRAVGSIGYAGAAYVIGNAAAKLGAFIVPLFIIASYVLLLATLFFFPAVKSGIGGNVPADDNLAIDGNGKKTDTFFFKKYPKFTIMFFGLIMIYIGHVFINNFTLQIIQTKGGDSAEMGTVASLAAIIELFMMFSFAYVRKYVSLRTLLRISGIAFTLKVLASLLVPNVGLYYAIQLLQLLGWGIMCVGLVYYVNEVMAPEDAVKGQAYATMTYTIATIVGSWSAGLLLDLSGVRLMLIVGTIVSGIGAAVLVLGTTKEKKVA
ncbi:MAG: MFS transporter [Dorea sp.]|nr:MFS transporter [Dorea sp.]